MNRNYPAYPGDGAAIALYERWADPRATEVEVAAAIHAIAGGRRTAGRIWSDPTPAEMGNVEMCLNEWAIHSDIEARTYRWGGDSITVNDA